ncbi:ABC-type sugar transport system, substrate-binding protein [Halalkaliarchaeum desulfuricum]|uniref:ABC-type sugar transport system, substrate-binding protein n=1 Tax=Halalkaliarchaeum desulfuricum TaxID=2055893 RepID=A0A343TIV5_9EURY|nr:extracellular solute-binding protein [Halalkaliarchaeum desulfuricum]AUX09027.1 ABC-type sugar transport system, substrate-binding protein [Halalkaliarchaeum desulfuricum]
MDRRRRTLLKAIGGSTALATLAGCVTTEEEPDGAGQDDETDPDGEADSDDEAATGQAMMWVDMLEAEEDDLEDYIAEFEAETGHVIDKEAPGGELDEQLETAIPAGDGPDSWVWAHDWVGRFAVREEPPFLYDATDDIDVDLDAYTGAARDAVQFDGGLYGLPFASETVTLFYNEDMVSEPPETFDEMVEIMNDYHDPAAGEYGLSYPATDPYFASGFLQAYGGDLYDEGAHEVGVDSDEVKQGLEALETLFDYIPADPSYESQIVAFADGLAPFAINGPWELGNLVEEIDNLGVTALPTVDGNHPRTFSGVQMFYFSSMLADGDQSTVDAITDFVEWYTTNEEVVSNNADHHGYIPVLEELVEGNDLPANVQAFAQQVDHGVPMPTHPNMDSVWIPVEEALSRVFDDEQDRDAALDQAAEEIREQI